MMTSLKNLTKEYSRKILIVVMAISIIFPTLALIPPKPAEAQLAVIDSVNAALKSVGNGILGALNAFSQAVIGGGITALVTKEYALDPIFTSIAKMIIRSMTQSIIAWASNGFQGNPAFVQNPKQFFTDAADQAIGQLLYDSSLSWMCSPFQLQLRLALVFSRSFQQQAQCTLTQVVSNFEGFVSGVNNELGTLGGWEAWSVMTTEPQNNPYGAFALLSAQAEAKVTGAKERSLLEISLGKGFLNWKDPACVDSANAARQAIDDEDPAALAERDEDFVGPPQNTDPNNCRTFTPGSVIADQINETLSIPGQELVAADEINEVISAVLAGLVKQALGGSGLFGAGQSQSISGESSYLAQFEEEDRRYFEQNKADNINQVNLLSSAENRYISVKNQSLARIDLSANKAIEVINCYEGKLTDNSQTLSESDKATAQQEITSASSTLSLINSYGTPIKSDIAIGEVNLINTKNITDALLATTYEKRDDLFSIMNQFFSILGQLHHDGDVAGAEYERDYSIPELLTPLDGTNEAKLGQCLAFPDNDND